MIDVGDAVGGDTSVGSVPVNSEETRWRFLPVSEYLNLPGGAAACVGRYDARIQIVIGSAAGTGLGIWASRTFIPYLQMGADVTAYTPPFIIEIAWPAILRLYALFAALFVVALGVLVRSLVKMKLFQAIKMGETV